MHMNHLQILMSLHLAHARHIFIKSLQELCGQGLSEDVMRLIGSQVMSFKGIGYDLVQ